MMSHKALLLTSVVLIGSMTASFAQGTGEGAGNGPGPQAAPGPQATAPMAAGPQSRGQGPHMRGAVMFNLLDTDDSGTLDASEIEALTASMIETLDTDGDGELTQQEARGLFQGHGKPGAREHRGSRGDRAEFRRGPQGGKGDMHRGSRGDRAEYRSGPRSGQQAGQPSGPRFGDGQFQMRFAERLGIDADGLTQDEFLKRHQDRFAALDTDGDGTITQEEFAAHMPQGPRSRGMR